MSDKTRVFHMALEPLETRYTGQWLRTIKPNLEKLGVEVIDCLGVTPSVTTSPGAFLDFANTNIWKNTQLNKIAEMFSSGQIKPGDRFLFTDAWNTAILQLKYMSNLLHIPIEIHSMWHAGSYDPWDFLGRCIKDEWVRDTERALFNASDFNYFATYFHISLFTKTYEEFTDSPKIIRSGQPHFEIITDLTENYAGIPKKDVIFFPHRNAPEKMPQVFAALKKALPQYKFIAAYEENINTKAQYYKIMAESKIMFSAALQETLGICGMEALLLDTIPLVPSRLSYMEMYRSEFMYPSYWADTKSVSLEHLVKRIDDMMVSYEQFIPSMNKNSFSMGKYLLPDVMFRNLSR